MILPIPGRITCHQRLAMSGLTVAVMLSCVTGFAERVSAAESEAAAPEGTRSPKFGGPDSVETTVEEDAEDKRPLFETGFLDPYHEWKKSFTERTSFSYGVDYSTIYLNANESPGNDDASGGMIRFYGTWDLVGRESGNTGTFVWKVEHRHKYGSIPPVGLSSDLGNVGLFTPPFSDEGLRLTNLYWRQRLNEGRFSLWRAFWM